MRNSLEDCIEKCLRDKAITGGVVSYSGPRTDLHIKPFGKVRTLAQNTFRDCRNDDIFLVASTTKIVVSVAILLLLERKRIQLQDPISKYLPELAPEWSKVLIENLLTHTAGVIDMAPDDAALRSVQAKVAEFVKVATEYSPKFEAGSGIEYSSLGFGLLGDIVEQVSGQSLREYVYEEILLPLEMNDSYLGLGNLPRDRLVRVETPDDGNRELYRSRQWDSDYWRDFGAPWGGLHTTGADFVKLLRELSSNDATENRLGISKAWKSRFCADQISGRCEAVVKTPFTGTALGLGVALNCPPGVHYMPPSASAQTFGHGGATGCTAWVDPTRGICATIFTNHPGCNRSLSILGDALIEDWDKR